jgi:hypothetical protein
LLFAGQAPDWAKCPIFITAAKKMYNVPLPRGARRLKPGGFLTNARFSRAS